MRIDQLESVASAELGDPGQQRYQEKQRDQPPSSWWIQPTRVEDFQAFVPPLLRYRADDPVRLVRATISQRISNTARGATTLTSAIRAICINRDRTKTPKLPASAGFGNARLRLSIRNLLPGPSVGCACGILSRLGRAGPAGYPSGSTF